MMLAITHGKEERLHDYDDIVIRMLIDKMLIVHR